MASNLRGIVPAGVAAVVTIGIAAVLPRPDSLHFLAVILGVVAGVYLGFALLDGRPKETALEVAGIAFFVYLALAALNIDTRILAAGFFLHILWDLAHHPQGIQTKIVGWYPPACVLFDGLVGAFILYWWR